MNTPNHPFVVLTLIVITGFSIPASASPDQRDVENQLGTNGRLAWEFHNTLENRYGLGLRFPGYIIGVEKANRRRIGNVPGIKVDSYIKIEKAQGINKNYLISILNDNRRTFISHIVRYDMYPGRTAGVPRKSVANRLPHLRANIRYNIYKELKHRRLNPHNAYSHSWFLMRSLQRELVKRIRKHKYTHIILLSTGWNIDQQEALRNYNSLVGHTLEQAYAENSEFKPLVIGFTWPAKWYIPGVSFINKANDADEVGVTWANGLIHDVLLPAKQKTNIKLVLIGHSFGARVLSRGLYSRHLLPARAESNTKVDLLIGLQGAFSINRFINKTGNEGSPYRHFKRFTRKVVLTWSRHDFATPIPKYIANVNYCGSRYGYKMSRRGKGRRLFHYTIADKRGHVDLSGNQSNKILYINASEIIKYRQYRKAGKAHSDIYKQQIGRMLWRLIKTYTQ